MALTPDRPEADRTPGADAGSSLVMLDTQTGTRTTIVSGAGKISEPTWSR